MMYDYSYSRSHQPYGYPLPYPITAHVKSSSSPPDIPFRSEKHHAPTPPQQTYYHYAITDIPTTAPHIATSRLCAPFVGVSLIEIAVAVLQTIFCFLYIITGQAILRAAHLEGYEAPISSSVKIGAMGGVALTLPAIFFCIHRRHGFVFAMWSIAVDILIGAMAGPIGIAILAHRLREKLLDPLHAARAGALGACIISTSLHVLRRY